MLLPPAARALPDQGCLQVAPAKPGRPREVMIAISNYNLVATNMLPLWLKVLP